MKNFCRFQVDPGGKTGRPTSPRRWLVLVMTLAVASASGVARAGSVAGTVATFVSPGGVQEQCIRIEDFPGARYSEQDRETETA